jgi:hypothetical protein
MTGTSPKYWPAILGFVLQAPSLWNFFIWALDWQGRFYTLVATYHNVGGYSAMIGFILNPPPWFYPLAFGIGFILILWDVNRDKRAKIKVERPVNWYLVITVIGGLIFISGIAGFIYDRSLGPITWDFDAAMPPFGVSRGRGEPLWIDAFQITGHNRSDDPINVQSAFVRSDVTNRTLPLTFAVRGEQVPLNEASITPQGSFILVAIIPSTDARKTQGIMVDEFRSEFERFTFVFEYNGQKLVKHFKENDGEAFINKADRETREALSQKSWGLDGGVVKK